MQDGDTPLHDAARGGHTAMAEVLMKGGADVKATNKVSTNLQESTDGVGSKHVLNSIG